jgi:hypothetical protein
MDKSNKALVTVRLKLQSFKLTQQCSTSDVTLIDIDPQIF